MFCLLPLQILDEIDRYRISIYDFPECDSDDDDLLRKHISDLKVMGCYNSFVGLWCILYVNNIHLAHCTSVHIVMYTGDQN